MRPSSDAMRAFCEDLLSELIRPEVTVNTRACHACANVECDGVCVGVCVGVGVEVCACAADSDKKRLHQQSGQKEDVASRQRDRRCLAPNRYAIALRVCWHMRSDQGLRMYSRKTA